MNAELIGALASGLCLTLGTIFGLMKWMINKFLAELKPNGGGSMKDQITRLETRVDDIYTILAKRSE